jgi:uncharacterized protein YdaU (DUF1376 family)
MTTSDYYLKTEHAHELADTMRFSLKARGAYFTLMLEYGREGSLPDDGEKVRKIAGAAPREWPAIADELQEKVFTRDWRHERWDRQMSTRCSRSKAGKASAEARGRAPPPPRTPAEELDMIPF